MKEAKMIAPSGYGQFCPVAMAAEVLCTRWTVILLRELIAGSTRFNELRRGVPRMSPALLSTRLKELEQAGIVSRSPGPEPGVYEYRLTSAGEDLRDVVMSIGNWGQRWVDTQLSLKNLDPSLLMWDVRRNLDTTPMPKRKCVIQFIYGDLIPKRRNWWLIVAPDMSVDLCSVDPGLNVDLFVTCELKTMTAVWMGLTTVTAEIQGERLVLTGDAELSRSIQVWLGLSPFAREKKRVAG
jgi:DNA-binding HxlR family transcriptional regulator